MRLRYRICFVGLLVVVAAAVLWAGRSREPSYQGKRLSEWMDMLAFFGTTNASPSQEQAAEAIRHIGTNALPFLLAELRCKDSTFKQALGWLNEKQSVLKFRFGPAQARRRRAALAFRALGSAAEPAIPALAAMLNDAGVSGLEVGYALGAIGPESLQTLTNALTNQNPLIRTSSLCGLGLMEWQAAAAVPAIVGLLKDPNLDVRLSSLWELERIHRNGALAVPALVSCLEDQNGGVRLLAVSALAAYGAEAKPAVPAVLKVFEDRSENIRFAATNALKKIDPEAAAKAGIQ